MASITFNAYKKNQLNGAIDLDSDTIRVALVTDGYAPDIDNDEFFDDITDELPTAGGYVADGAEITGKTVTQDNTDNEGVFDGDDMEWDASTITARAGVIYKDTGNAATSPLIRYHDFGSDQVTTGTKFKITWAAEGILNSNDP